MTLNDVPTPTDRKVSSMQEEVRVASPEPGVGVFTTAETCQGRLGRTGRGHGSGETTEMGNKTAANSNGDSNSSSQPLTPATGHSA
jgi:hypothetical protein